MSSNEVTVSHNIYDSRQFQNGFYGSIRVIHRRYKLIIQLSKIDMIGKYKRSVFGIFWSFLNPLLVSSVIYFVFGRIFNGYMPGSRGYASWVLSGVLLQGLLLTGITVSSSSLQQNISMISRNRIEPILVAISSAISHTLHFFIGVVALIPLAIFTHQKISIRLIFLPFFGLAVILWLTGLGLLLVGWFMRFDDATYLFNAALMIVSYLSPFLYPISILSPKLKHFVELNPITSYVVTFRWLFYGSQDITKLNILTMILSSTLSILMGIKWIQKRWNDYVML